MAADARRCAHCGFDNPPSANFCANCGRTLADGLPPAAGQILTAEARRVSTAVFADLVGSTGLTERLDRHAPLCLVCVARPELLERRSAWGAGGRNQLHLDLSPLTPDETEQLVDALSPRPLRPEVRRALAQRAEGTPLFTGELVRRPAPGGDHAPVLRRALELRVALFRRPEDRAALDRLHRQVADNLPDDLRATFLSSPRVRTLAAASP